MAGDLVRRMAGGAMTPIGPVAYVAYVAIVLGQLVYWLLLRDDGHERIVWAACLLLRTVEVAEQVETEVHMREATARPIRALKAL